MRNMKRTISLILSAVCVILLIGGCRKPAEESAVSPKVFAITGPTGVGMVNLMEDYDITLSAAPDEVVGKVASGEADIAAVPTNVASSLYKKLNGGVTVLCVNTLGVLYMMDSTGAIQSFSDLEGKTIYSTGEGANPQYILEYLLKKNNVNATISYLATNDELTGKMASGEIEIAMVPQPAATSVQAKTSFKIALDITSEWAKVSPESKLMMGCLVVRNEYLDAHKKDVERFLKDYKASVEQVNSDTAAAAQLCETYQIIPSAKIAETAIPYCNITYITGKEMKSGLSGYLQVLFDANPASVGGAMPEDGFYYGA